MQRIVRLRGQLPIVGEALTCLESKLGERFITWKFEEGQEEASLAVIEVGEAPEEEADETALTLVREAAEACGVALNPEIRA